MDWDEEGEGSGMSHSFIFLPRTPLLTYRSQSVTNNSWH